MRVLRPMTFFMAFCLILVSPQILKGIEEETPIIAVSGSSIYAVSPDDGKARLLVERDASKDAVLEEFYVNFKPTLSLISPTQTHVAYVAPLYEMLDPAYDDDRYDLTSRGPNDLFLLDIATGDQTNITNQDDDFDESLAQYKLRVFSDPIWSVDGQRLYFRTIIQSLRNRAPTTMIEYYDLETKTRHTFVDFKAQTGVMGIYPIHGGLAVLRLKDNNAAYELMLYLSDGQLVERQALELLDSWGPTNGTMFTMNPVLNEGGPNYGYYAEDDEGLLKPAVLHIGSGSTVAIADDFTFPAVISHATPETSLRLVFIDPYSDRPWRVTDPDGNVQNEMRLEDVAFQSDLGLSPDGETIAFLSGTHSSDGEPVPIMVMDDEGVRELNFKANRIQWAPIDYIFSHVEPQG